MHCGISVDIAREWNTVRADGYDATMYVSSQIGQMVLFCSQPLNNLPSKLLGSFDELVTRYEEPEARNRWDSPLFTVLYDDAMIPEEGIWNAVILQKPLPPNLSTVVVSVLHWLISHLLCNNSS